MKIMEKVFLFLANLLLLVLRYMLLYVYRILYRNFQTDGNLASFNISKIFMTVCFIKSKNLKY